MASKLRNALMFAPLLAGGCLAEQGVPTDTRAGGGASDDAVDVREVIDPVTPEAIDPATPEAIDSGPPEVVEQDTGHTPDLPLVGESWTLSSSQPVEVKAQSEVVVTLGVPAGVLPASVEWSLEQPDGSVSLLVSSDLLHASVIANNVGHYRIVAVVLDSQGQVIAHAAHTFLVAAGPGLHIELSWHTPGDLDESDGNDPLSFFSVGSDVDLHLQSPKADGEFFGSYDCYFANANPEWGIFAPHDNPALDRDDVDGAGPEITTLQEPEAGAVYTVGVHYYDDWGYGDSLATLRIFVDGILQDEWAGVNLRMDDMWESHTIVDGVVTRIGTEPAITPSYFY